MMCFISLCIRLAKHMSDLNVMCIISLQCHMYMHKRSVLYGQSAG